MHEHEPLAEYLNTAVAAAREAGALQLEMRRGNLEIEAKAFDSDLVTKADKACEERIREVILAAHPGHAIVGEEGGEVGTGTHRWIVDPVDGTVNYAHGYPHFCVSIGLEIRGELAVGVVFDPSTNELFTATKGGGAFLNGEAIRVSSAAALNGRAMLATGSPADPAMAKRDLAIVDRLIDLGVPVRRAGSGALDLCYVACGRVDALFESQLMPWDCAAGNLLILEAGGKITHYDGRPHRMKSATHAEVSIVASGGAIHAALLEVIGGS